MSLIPRLSLFLRISGLKDKFHCVMFSDADRRYPNICDVRTALLQENRKPKRSAFTPILSVPQLTKPRPNASSGVQLFPAASYITPWYII